MLEPGSQAMDTFGRQLLEAGSHSRSTLMSFPSGHAAVAFGLAASLGWYFPAGRPAFIALAILASLLHAASGVPRREVLSEEWRLSAFMAIGSAGIGAMAVALADNPDTRALVPFVLLPALALWYAYGAAAQHAEARERNKWLVKLGGLLTHFLRFSCQPRTIATRAADGLASMSSAWESIIRRTSAGSR
jgi:hypothetical protein